VASSVRAGLFRRVVAVLGIGVALGAAAAELQVVGHPMPEAARSAVAVARMGETNRLKLAVALPLRNRPALTNLLRDLYNPASTNYHRFLKPAEFAKRFAPTQSDYDRLRAFLKGRGFKVTAQHPNRTLVDVEGPVSKVESAFDVTMKVYRHPLEGRTFYAPSASPRLKLSVPVLQVTGLDNFSLPKTRIATAQVIEEGKSLLKLSPRAGTGPSGAYMGNDFRAAYASDTAMTGAGQVVGLVQFDGYSASDIAYYKTAAGLPDVPLMNVLLDGFNGAPTGSGGEVEVALDIETAISMAPGLSKVVVYMAGPYGSWYDVLNRIATDNLAKQISCSWYSPYKGADAVADQIFQQMAAQGQSFFNASGDYNAFTGLIPFPGDTPYITQVGGTTLTADTASGAYVSEVVWNRGNGVGSGGGISTQYAIPAWQTNISMANNQGSATMRNVPDVALTAEQVYVRANGRNYSVGGTSCAAPLWAGFAALANQLAAASGRSAIGFVNPAIDEIASGAKYSACFHDITVGNNTSSSSPSRFYAAAGYDLCTGWGTPAGNSLIVALGNPEPLLISPAAGFDAIGGLGGPFSVRSNVFTLVNSGTNALSWTAASTVSWLSLSASSGTLARGGGSTKLTAALNASAAGLGFGSYTGAIWFTNQSDGVGQSRQVTLAVIPAPRITEQPADLSVLDGETARFSAGVDGGLPRTYRWRLDGVDLKDGGRISGSATTNLVIAGASVADLGHYSLVASNAAGWIYSSNALLSLTPSEPRITEQPVSQTVGVRSTVIFSVDAVGTKPFAYQWSSNGSPIVGATGATLTLTNVQLTASGNYAVVISNALGWAASSNATLTVVPCSPVSDGLAAWLRAEGDVSDSVGGNLGAVNGALAYAAGEVGTAFVLNGSTSYIAFPASSSLNLGAGSGITIEAWIQPASTATQGPIAEWDNSYTDGLQFWVEPSLQLYANIVDNTGLGHTLTAPSGLLKTNAFQHVALTYDKATGVGAIYLNGSVVVSSNWGSFTPQTTYDLNIGRRLGQPIGLGQTYSGLIDELSLYSRGLSQAEVKSIYAAASGGKCPLAPAIVKQPASQTVAEGYSVSFRVQVSGTPPLAYQWSFNGANLASATNALLTLTNVQFSQAGSYAVLVDSPYGSAMSSNALLTVVPVPPCVAAASDLVAWWRAEGDSSDFLGGNAGTVYGALGYSVGEVGKAFSFDGGTSFISCPAAATLDIGAGPGVTIEAWIQPASDQTQGPIAEWDSDSTDGLQFWVEPGLQLYANIVDSSGAGHTLTAPSGLLSTNAMQHVALTYDKTSGVGIIYLNGAAVVSNYWGGFTPQTTYPMNIGRRLGQPVGLGQTYSGLIDELSLYRRCLGQSEIQAIYAAASGGKCVPPPTIVSQPASQTQPVGGTAVFSVTAAGAGSLAYQWMFNGAGLAQATNSTLILSNLQTAQAGVYAVRVTNDFGSVLSSNAALAVTSAAACSEPAAGLAVWWRGDGNGLDSISTNAGTLVGGVSFTNGQVGQGFLLDGATGSVAVPASDSLNIGAGDGITIECWIWPDNPAQIGMPVVEWNSGFSDGLQLWMESSLRLFANVNDTSGTGHVLVSAEGLVQNQQFQHVALTYDKSSGIGRLYLNGAVVASENLGSFTPQTTYPLNLGLRPSSGERFKGRLDEVSLYERALSSNQIAAIYLAGSGGKCTPVPPAITSQPTNLTVVAGATAEFDVVAIGTAPLTYLWSFNGTNLAGSTNSALVLTNVQMAQAGVYAVAVKNAFGNVMSSNAVLTVAPAPVCVPAPDDLVALWHGNGNSADSVGGNAGIVYGSLEYAAGKAGQCFLLDGSTSYISCPATPSLDIGTGTGITIEAWIQPASDQTQGPIAEWDSASTDGLQFWVEPGLQLYANLPDTSGAGHTLVAASGLLSTNAMQHVALTYDKTSGVGIIYLNGAAVVSNYWGSFTPQTTYPMNIGRRLGQAIGLGQTFSGLIDELSLYRRCLGQTEILAICAAGAGGKCPVAPGILSQPASQKAALGGSATFQAVVVGTAPLEYQWRFNGASITNATNAALVLSNLVADLAGDYSVAVSNAYGFALSSNATLTIGSAPVITVQPTNQTAMAGDAVSFSVTATGDAPLSYRWFFAGSAISTATNASAATATLLLTNVATGQAGIYKVLVTNTLGAVFSSNVTLTLYAAPKITTQPKSQNVNAGTNVTFSVTASGTAPLAYQWSFNGTNIVRATNSSLTLTNIQPEQAGAYAVQVTNLYGSALSSNAVLAIGLLPVITSHPTAQYVASGSNATFSVGVSSNSLPVTYQWYLYGSSKLVGATNSTYIVSNAQTYYSGYYYRVAVSNAYGSVFSSNATLYVGARPIITAQPKSQAVVSGANVSLSVTASGTSTLRYQWRVSDTNIAKATNSSLTLTNIQLAQAGSYSVLVTNLYGAVQSSNAVITVAAVAPSIASQPVSQTVLAGGRAGFAVSVTGSLPMAYQWAFKGANLANATNALLTLTNVQPAQAGDYAVLVTNAFGAALSSNATLTVISNLPCGPAPSDLAAWWAAEGTALDSFGTNAGVVNGSLSYTNGMVGQAFCFDGSTSYINLPASPALDIGTGSGITVEAWIQPASTATQGPIAEWDSASTDGLQFWVEPGLQLYANLPDTSGAGHTLVAASGLLSTTAMQHVALTYDKASGVACIYLNGAVVASNAWSSFTPQTTYLLNVGRRLGQPVGLGQTYSGLIDELSLYRRCLSQSEIQAIYFAASNGKCPPAAPVVTNQPVGQLLRPGCAAALSAAASGSSPLAYAWAKDGSLLAGKTNPVLYLDNIQATNFGAYSVVVSNGYGVAISSNAVLALDSLPVPGADVLTRLVSGGIKVRAADLLTNDTDADADALSVLSVASNSAAGGTVYLKSNWVFYNPPAGFTNADSFTYTVSDGHCGGVALGTVSVVVGTNNLPTGNFTLQMVGDNAVLTFHGVPGFTYRIQYTDSLTEPDWKDLGTATADGLGVYQFTDGAPIIYNGARYYRSVWP
jgi:hypothetical protein